MSWRSVCLLMALLGLCSVTLGQLGNRKEVSIGYNLNYNPWKLAINKGLFEKVTGYTIKWTEIKDTYKAVVAMANDEVQMVVANSVDIGRAFSRGLECRLIWVVEDLHDSEGLIVHDHYHAITGAQWGGTVANPSDLKGKVIAVWYGSTMHYALHSFYSEMRIDIVETTVYQRHGCRIDATEGQLQPCYFKENQNAVTFLSLMPEEIGVEWGVPDGLGSSHRRLMGTSACAVYPDPGTCYPTSFEAAYVGYPYMQEMKKTGQVLFTNAMLARWEKVTFTGLLVQSAFLYELNPKYATYNVANFIKIFIDEMAKANYYYWNNTKEFELDYDEDSVPRKTASVIGGYADLVAPHLKMFKYPTAEEQVSCKWLGCNQSSRIAWALADQSRFLKEVIKLDYNLVPITYGPVDIPLVEYQLAETIEDYSKYIDMSYIEENLKNGLNGSYFLIPGDEVHLGYQTTANYGRTISLIIT